MCTRTAVPAMVPIFRDQDMGASMQENSITLIANCSASVCEWRRSRDHATLAYNRGEPWRKN